MCSVVAKIRKQSALAFGCRSLGSLCWSSGNVGHQVPKYLPGGVPRYLGTPQVAPGFVSDSPLYLGIFFGKRHAIKFNKIN